MGQSDLRGGELRLLLDFRVVESPPAETAGFGWVPITACARFWRIDAQNVLKSPPSQFGEGDFTAVADFASAGVNVVGQFDLCARHADRLPSPVTMSIRWHDPLRAGDERGLQAGVICAKFCP